MTALGLSLLVVGAIIIVVEAHIPTLGMLGGAGVIALGAGAVLTVGGLGGGLVLGLISALLLVLVGIGVVAISLHKGVAVRRRRISTGAEGLVGHLGVVRSWGEPAGSVLLEGTLWRARLAWSDEESTELREGDPVVVERLNGLTLAVRRAEAWELAP
ncbi:MAG: NfeD family protein [Solirubrobacteraceae bacterium]